MSPPFDAIETSREGGNVAEFFSFVLGPVSYRFTSFGSDVVFGGLSYLETQISRSKIEASNSEAANVVKITVPATNPVAVRYIANTPGYTAAVQILRGHADDPSEQTVVLFEGYIDHVAFTGDISAEIVCKPDTDILRRSGPRISYQGLCNHFLYDARCKVNPAAFTYTGLVSGVSGDQITVNGVAANGADWAVGGYVRAPSGAQDDARLVIAQASDTLTLLSPFSIPVLSTNVDVLAGCDHSLATCQSKFANVINFGGYPYVPPKNPFNGTLRGGS